jgi:hypothetical protein
VGIVVLPGRSYATEISVTPVDTAGLTNLRMDSVGAAFLHNESATGAAAVIRDLAGNSHTIFVSGGDSFSLSPNDANLMATGTGAGPWKAFF